MRRFRKFCALLLSACLLAMLAGCGAKEGTEGESGEIQTLDIYASFYPVYATSAMIADGVPDLTLHLLAQPQDGCLRAYSLSDWDAALLASADGLLLCGGGLESFAGAVSAQSDQLAVAQIADGAERVENSPLNADPEAAPHWSGENPHVYMSIDGAIELATSLANSMALFDPRYEAKYQENLASTKERLENLKAQISAETARISGAKAAVLNEALVYTARDCGLDAVYWARESGETMDETALEDLLAALGERDIHLVLIERQAPQSLLEALEAAGLAVAKLDVLSTHRANEGSEAYLDALLSNAEIVREAYESIESISEEGQ